MKRSEVIEQYDVDADGYIATPGKFEAFRLYAPHFYEAYLNGEATEDDGEVLTFDVTDEDRAEYPELKDAIHVLMYVSDDGFVSYTLGFAPPVR